MRKVLAVFAMIGCALAAFTVTRGDLPEVPVEQSVSVMFSRCLSSDGGFNLPCMSEAIADAVDSTSDLAGLATAIVERVGDDEMLLRSCHGVMHILGRAEPVTLVASPPQDDVWLACGNGLIHGAVEYAELPDGESAAGAEISALCAKFQASLFGSCVHSAGHAASFNNEGDILAAIRICELAFEGTASQACRVGALMILRDDIVQRVDQGELPAPKDPESLDVVAADCKKLPPMYQVDCVRGLTLKVLETGEELVPMFMDWCESSFPDATATCEHDTGVTLGLQFSAHIDRAIPLCDDRDGCIAGIGSGLIDFIGAEAATQRVCDALGSKNKENVRRCAMVTDAISRYGQSDGNEQDASSAPSEATRQP
jgi:hypothetical protein